VPPAAMRCAQRRTQRDGSASPECCAGAMLIRSP
jgi:hypothetical protein